MRRVGEWAGQVAIFWCRVVFCFIAAVSISSMFLFSIFLSSLRSIGKAWLLRFSAYARPLMVRAGQLVTEQCRSCENLSQSCILILAIAQESCRNSPKCSLNASHIILPPVPPHHLLLPNRHPAPLHPHHRHMVRLVLIEPYRQSREVALDPSAQSPFLHNQRRLLKLFEFARDVAPEEAEFSSWVGTFVEAGSRSREGCEALRVGEGLVELRGCGAEFVVFGDGGGVDGVAC